MYAEIGAKIKRLRSEKKLTLKELSELTNLSVGFLSQLERGMTSVAIDSLDSIARVFEVDISYFFSLAKEQGNIAVRSYERNIAFMDKSNFIQYSLSGSLKDKTMFPRLIEVYPKKDNEAVESYTHEGEEFIHVLEGILTFYYNGEKYELFPGDSVHINSNELHNWENATNKMTKILVVSTPNKFQVHGTTDR